jgi:dGTPase
LVVDVIEHSNEKEGICFSDELFPYVEAMIRFNYTHIYKSPMLEGYERYFTRLFSLILDYLRMLMDTYGFEEAQYVEEKNMLAMGFYHHLMDMKSAYEEHDGNLRRNERQLLPGLCE